MTIPDEAVHAAVGAVDEGVNWVAGLFGEKYDNAEEAMKDALTAALPFLQGVKKEPVAWSIIFSDHYGVNCETTFKTKQAAENYVSSCGRGRVTPLYPDPSPRAQALEEVISELVDAQHKCFEWTGSAFLADELDATEDAECKAAIYKDLCALGNTMSWLQDQVRALSSQPVANALPQDVINLVIAARDAFDAISGCGIGAEIEADLDKALKAFASRVPYENEPDEDLVEVIPSSGCVFADMGVERPVADGWLPIETAPKDGTQFLAYNIANGYYNCWWHKNHHGEEYWMDEADTEPNPTHWRPLPASPGASE